MVDPGIGIMGRLARANGVGSLGLHRRRIHRRGGQEVDEVSAETFALFTGDKESQMDRRMKTQFRGKRNRIGIWVEIKASQNAKIKATA